MKALYRLYQDCGRSGSIDGLFIAERGAVEKLYGREVYFGEVLGKHSEVNFAMTANNLVEKSADPAVIEVLLSVFGTDSLTGFNPFDYIDEEEEIEDEEE